MKKSISRWQEWWNKFHDQEQFWSDLSRGFTGFPKMNLPNLPEGGTAPVTDPENPGW
jgi:hypothetical protein